MIRQDRVQFFTRPDIRNRIYGSRWRKVRAAVLERDNYLCRIRRPGCTVRATQADHIISPMDGGAWWDEANCRAACAHCNAVVRDEAKRRRSRRAPSRDW